jgi:hypothetical protein
MSLDRRHVESIATLVNQGKAILFVGEGVSAEAHLRHRITIGGEEICDFVREDHLARILCRELSLSGLALPEAAERFERRLGRVSLNEMLWQLFRNLEPAPVHRLIVRIGFKWLYTTNFDSLLELAFKEELGFHPMIAVRNTDVPLVRERSTIIKLHGDISQPDTIMITETDHADYPRGREALFDVLQADLYAHSFVFLGYGLRDNSLRSLYRSMASVLGRFVNLSYAIMPAEEIDQEAESIWRDNYRIQLLGSDTLGFSKTLDNAVKRDQQKSIRAQRQRRIDSARQHFAAQADNYDRAILVYLGSSQDLEALGSKLTEEHITQKRVFAAVDFKATGPFNGSAGLFRYMLETLVRDLKASVQRICGETTDYELDFSEYERKAQSEQYRYLYLQYGERADRMMQGEESIPNRSAAQEISDQTFVKAAVQDFVVLLNYVTEKAGAQRIILFLDRLDMIAQFLPTLQAELLEKVIHNVRNALFVISYAGSDPPRWDGYAFEDRCVQYHKLPGASQGNF